MNLATFSQRLLVETAGLGAEFRGAYTAAVLFVFTHGSLPANERDIIGIMDLRSSDASSIARRILERFFLQSSDGSWSYPDYREAAVEEARERAEKARRSIVFSERGRKGAAGKWGPNYVPKRIRRKRGDANGDACGITTGNAVLRTGKYLTPLPSQAQGVPPTQLGPRRVPDRRASHTSPKRQAAKRQRPVERPAAPQTSLPLSEVPATQPARRSVAASTVTARRCNSQTTPQDPRFDEIANELRTNFWPGVASGECPWHNKAKAALSRFLAGAGPEMSLGDVRLMLTHRADSIMARKITGSQPIEQWIERLHMWRNGPCDDFGKPVDTRRRM